MATLKHHWSALVLALCIGACTVVPFVFFTTDHAYRGVVMMGADAEEHYVARIQQVYAGYPALSNTFLPTKGQPYAIPGLGEIMVAAVGHVTHMDAASVSVFSKFLFPFIIALLIYILAYTLFKSRGAALLGTAAAMLGDNLLSGLSPWLAILHGSSEASGFLTFARPINPEVSAVFLFGALLVLYRGFFERAVPRTWEVVVVGVVTGASWYISPYAFTFLGMTIALLWIWSLLRRDHAFSMRTFATGAIALACLSPFVINYLHLHASPWYAALAMRQGVVHTHAPLLSVWLILLLGAVVFAWPKRYVASRPFFIIATLALWILTEQQVVTGLSLQPGHYHWYVTKPLIGLIVGMYAAYVADRFLRRESLRVFAVGAVLTVLFYNAALVQTSSYLAAYDTARAAQNYMPVLTYLNTRPHEETVWADPTLSLYIPIYTEHNAPNNDYSLFYLNPQSFYEDRLFLNYRLAGLSPDTALQTFTKDRAAISLRLFGIYYRDAEGSYAAIPNSILSTLAQKYQTFYSRPVQDVFRELGITMLVVDDGTSTSTYAVIPNARLSTALPGFTVYDVQ